MKRSFLTFIGLVLGIVFIQAQTQVNVSGTIYDSKSNAGIGNYNVFIFSDSIYNSSTSSFWYYNDYTSTDSFGAYSFSITVPNGISNGDFYVYVYDCDQNAEVQSFSFPPTSNTIDFRICSGSTSTCMAYFQAFADKNDLLKYSFYDYSYGNITSWKWDFGDSTTSSLQNPVHAYTSHGIYYPSLTITDSVNNCTDKFSYYLNTRDSIIYPGCMAYFYYYADSASMFTLNFIADSSSPTASYTWDFGDSSYGTGAVISHTFAKGRYKVCLTVSDSSQSCYDTYCDYITIPYKQPCYSYFYTTTNGDTAEFYAFGNNQTGSVYEWDFGDGTSLTDTSSHVVHVYAKKGSYYTCMISYNQLDTCMQYCDYVNTDSIYRTDIYGMVFTGNYPADHATIYLIQYNEKDSMISAIDSMILDSSGFYWFPSVAVGKYYIKAALNSNSKYYADYFPTWLDTSVYWKYATEIEVDNNPLVYPLDIYMVKGNNPGGQGFIGGKVTKGSNYRSGGLMGVEVLLLDNSGKAVAYTYSNSDGDFSFKNVALGTYKVFADILGIESEFLIVELNSQNKTVDNVNIEVNKDGITLSIKGLIPGLVENSVKIYPNPAKQDLYLKLSMLQNAHGFLSIYNTIGERVYSNEIELNQGNNQFEISVSDFPKGIYMMNLNIEGKGNINYRFLKVE